MTDTTNTVHNQADGQQEDGLAGDDASLSDDTSRDSECESEENTDSDCEGVMEVVDSMEEAANGDTVTVGEVLDAVSNRGFGPLLLIPALISLSPLGGIPGMSIVTGTLIFVIAGQMLFRSDHPWVPKRLEQVSFAKKKLDGSIDRSRGWVKWADRFIGPRLTVLTTGPMHYVLAVVMMGLSITYFPLALVPFGVFLPSLANTLLAAGITVEDGLLVSLGLAATAAAGYAVIATVL